MTLCDAHGGQSQVQSQREWFISLPVAKLLRLGNFSAAWADFEIDYSNSVSFTCVFSCFAYWQSDMKLLNCLIWCFRSLYSQRSLAAYKESCGSQKFVPFFLLQVSSTLGRAQSHFCDPKRSLPDWTGSKLGVAYGAGGWLPFPIFLLCGKCRQW